jgi:hypothetical protein
MEIVVTGLWPVGQLLARSLGSQIFDLDHRMNFPCGRSPRMMITFGSRVISQMIGVGFRSCIARLGRGRRSRRDLEWKALENGGVPPELACSCHKACTTLGLNRNEDSEQLFVSSWKPLNLSSQSAGPF